MSEHKPDPEFAEYLESQVKNPFLSSNVVMQMERVFIDQRNKYEAARAQGGEAVAWVSPLRHGSQVTFQRPDPPEWWSDFADEWYCRPLVYADTPQPDKWINCNFVLPTEKLWISGLTNTGQVIPAMLINNGDSAFFRTANDEISEGAIVAWQPLPTPPEEGAER